MTDLSDLTLAILGGGVVGLTLGVLAAQSGARTTLYEKDAAIDSASGVAAGMLAPAFEAALDPISAGHFAFMRAARDAWPEMIGALDLPSAALHRSGALRAGGADEGAWLIDLETRMQAMGAACERLDAMALRRLRPELSPTLAGGVFTPEDWRIDPAAILPALEAAFDRSGGRRVAAAATLDASGRFGADGDPIAADAIVVAAGAGALAWRDPIPELAALHPIKGQILTFGAEPRGGPVVRGPQGYVAPQPGGAMAGATMEIGRTDLATDAAAVERLRRGAIALFPHLAGAASRARAGVRAATADGLPLVGASRARGVHLAVGARRNGWLLAPLMARVILDELAGRTSPHAALLRASRFASLGS
jgi:glycine oxidase